MKEIYDLYKDNNIEFVGVANDNETQWKKALDKYNLPWLNVIDQEYRAAKSYNVKSYPATFLINPEGKIIAKNLRPNKNLKQSLNELFK